MTTIATDGRTIAGDGRMLKDSRLIFAEDYVKVRRLSDGSVLGFSGEPQTLEQLIERWPETGWYPNAFQALILTLDGNVLALDEKLKPVRATPPLAIGSGSEIALGAMLAGLSPKQAVTLAATRDVITGGVIIELEPEAAV